MFVTSTPKTNYRTMRGRQLGGLSSADIPAGMTVREFVQRMIDNPARYPLPMVAQNEIAALYKSSPDAVLPYIDRPGKDFMEDRPGMSLDHAATLNHDLYAYRNNIRAMNPERSRWVALRDTVENVATKIVTSPISMLALTGGLMLTLAQKAGIGPGRPMPEPVPAPREITQADIDRAQAEADAKAQAEYDAQWQKDNAAALAAQAANVAPVAPNLLPPSALDPATVAIAPVSPSASSVIGARSAATQTLDTGAMLQSDPGYSPLPQIPSSWQGDVPPIVESAAKADKKIPWGAITTAGVLALTFLKK